MALAKSQVIVPWAGGAWVVFILAHLLLLPLGIAAIKGSKQLLRVPHEVLMLVFGLIAYLMEENGFPVAPAILGMVLGAMLEEHSSAP